MDLNYLIEILAIRKQEIVEGKNLATRTPVYVVLSLQEGICTGHDDYSCLTNNKGKEKEHGYLDFDLDPEDRKFKLNENGMGLPESVTRFWTDRFVAFFLTSEAAHSYLEYQAHNMNEPYVYVFSSGYSNRQMDKLLTGEN